MEKDMWSEKTVQDIIDDKKAQEGADEDDMLE